MCDYRSTEKLAHAKYVVITFSSKEKNEKLRSRGSPAPPKYVGYGHLQRKAQDALLGQGSVYLRCLEPLEEEDKDEKDEQLMTPAYHLCCDDLTENSAETSSSTSQKQDSESASTDPGGALLLKDPMPYFPEMWDNKSIDNNYNALVNINDVFSSTGPSNDGETAPSCDGEVPTKVIRVHRLHLWADMLEVLSDPSIFKFSLSAIIINQLGHEEVGRGIGVLREVFSLFWKNFYESHMLGETEGVPCIRHDFDRNKWEAVGRILVKGYTESQYFPHKMSKNLSSGMFLNLKPSL